MKYGNMGGWKAVRTFNRDARIRDGLSPYGYKARYARQGARESTPEAAWSKAVIRHHDKALKTLGEYYVYFEREEHLKFESFLDHHGVDWAVAEVELTEANSATFFRGSKQSSWHSRWPDHFVGLARDYEAAIKLGSLAADKRRNRHEKIKRSRNEFFGTFDERINGADENDKICAEIIGMRERMFLEMSAKFGWDIDDGVITYPAECWEDLVENENRIQDIIWKYYKALVAEQVDEIHALGLNISIASKRRCFVMVGVEFPIKKLRV